MYRFHALPFLNLLIAGSVVFLSSYSLVRAIRKGYFLPARRYAPLRIYSRTHPFPYWFSFIFFIIFLLFGLWYGWQAIAAGPFD